jgi:PhnB protein
VNDVDEFCRRAMAHPGTRTLEPVADKFYGDRSFKMSDPFGHVWMFATRIEDVPPEEMERRAAEFFANMK